MAEGGVAALVVLVFFNVSDCFGASTVFFSSGINTRLTVLRGSAVVFAGAGAVDVVVAVGALAL